jgi:hypothetical protein
VAAARNQVPDSPAYLAFSLHSLPQRGSECACALYRDLVNSAGLLLRCGEDYVQPALVFAADVQQEGGATVDRERESKKQRGDSSARGWVGLFFLLLILRVLFCFVLASAFFFVVLQVVCFGGLF